MCVCLYEFAPLNLMPGAHAAHLTGHVYIGIYAYPLPAPLTPFCPICPMCNDKSVPMAVRAQFPSFSNSSGLRQDGENKKNEKKKTPLQCKTRENHKTSTDGHPERDRDPSEQGEKKR